MNLLESRKAVVRARIADRRLQCVEAAAGLTPPVEILDRGLALWRQVPPLAKAIAVPLLVLLARKLSRRAGWIGSIARLVPTVMGVARMVRQP